MLEKDIHRRKTVQARRVPDENKNLLSTTFYDEVTYILNDTRATYEIGKGKRDENTVTWSANLHITREALLPSPGKSPDIFKNGNC